MLSKTDLLILGIIAEKPINPYAIIKLINYKSNSIRRYIHPQTVYGVVNSLHRKKLISGKRMKNGNMPERTEYSITKKGEEMIRKSLISYLNTPEDNLSELVLSILLLGFVDKETVIEALKEYRQKIRNEIDISRKLSTRSKIPDEFYTRKIVARHTLDILLVNLKTVNELIDRVEADNRWQDFQVPWWRNEYLQDGEAQGD
ncbi:MAG: PadR family transcriptional regulator [Dehalococcoidales bacterium]|nr:PadR family transcriptional regulator [Dehalococcoidales bacterium]